MDRGIELVRAEGVETFHFEQHAVPCAYPEVEAHAVGQRAFDLYPRIKKEGFPEPELLEFGFQVFGHPFGAGDENGRCFLKYGHDVSWVVSRNRL